MRKLLHPWVLGALTLGLAAVTVSEASAQGCRPGFYAPRYVYSGGYYYPVYVYGGSGGYYVYGTTGQGTVSFYPLPATGTQTTQAPQTPSGNVSFYPLPAQGTAAAPAPRRRLFLESNDAAPPRAWQPGDPNPKLTHTNE